VAIKAIIFDCFEVLVISGHEDLRQKYPDVATELMDLSMQSDYGYISRIDYFQKVSKLTGLEVADIETKYWKNKVLNSVLIDWIGQLKKENKYKIGLLSNIGYEGINMFISPKDRNDMFDAVVLSSEVHMMKPSVAIFEEMARRLELDPSECVMIDDVVANIDGATMAGMKGIVYGSPRQVKEDVTVLTEAET